MSKCLFSVKSSARIETLAPVKAPAIDEGGIVATLRPYHALLILQQLERCLFSTVM